MHLVAIVAVLAALVLLLPIAIVYFPVIVIAIMVIWVWGRPAVKPTLAVAVLAAAAETWWIIDARHNNGEIPPTVVRGTFAATAVIAFLLRQIGRERRRRQAPAPRQLSPLQRWRRRAEKAHPATPPPTAGRLSSPRRRDSTTTREPKGTAPISAAQHATDPPASAASERPDQPVSHALQRAVHLRNNAARLINNRRPR